MPRPDSIHLHARFGLGPRGEERRAGFDAADDPRGHALAQLETPERALLTPDAEAGAPTKRAVDLLAAERAVKRPGPVRGRAYLEEGVARMAQCAQSDTPLLERLTLFWSDHFTVSATKARVAGLVGAFEREAIRPHILGRFADMLRAATQHPAMLIYLDNQISAGPNSPHGLRLGKGLNENLARELLELHTVGVEAGYSQTDVTNLARIITGWTVSPNALETNGFNFGPKMHEPGAWTVMGRLYAGGGRGAEISQEAVAKGLAVLEDLARSPATARRIARKLAVHFISDDPPPSLVAKLERRYLASEGDLGAVTRELVLAEECWSAPALKVTPPFDYIVAAIRAFGAAPKFREMRRILGRLAQPIWRAPSPNGWPVADMAWASPSALRERLRLAQRFAGLVDADPRALSARLFGGALDPATRRAVAAAGSPLEGRALLLMSPAYQRR